MGSRIEDGTGRGYLAKVTSDFRLDVSSRVNERVYYKSREGDAYSVVAVDAGPVAAEYPLYIKNISSSKNLVIQQIITSAHDADVRWKLHHVTGVAAGAAVIVPVNLNLASGKSADATCRGGAGGVTTLTSINVLWDWFQGVANSYNEVNPHSAIILGQNDAIAIEYDAGTGGACAISVEMYYD